MNIPNVPATGSVKLTVTVVYQTANGPITKYSENLLELTSNKDANHIILIQLNKPIYKATDAIGFRALILDQDLKLSSSVKTITAILKDAYGESVETKANVSTAFPGSSGYFEGTFHPLPFEPDFGNWSVEIVAQDIKTSKTLQVADYRLPRFGIDFSAPDRLTMNIPALTFTAFVRDQNGNPVIGSLEIAILDPSNSTTRALPLQASGTDILAPTYLCQLNHQALKKTFCENNIDGYITVTATAKEQLTNKVEKAEKRIPYHCTPFDIQLISPTDGFRAGVTNTIAIRIGNCNDILDPNALTAAVFTATEFSRIDDVLRSNRLEITEKTMDIETSISVLRVRPSVTAQRLIIKAVVKDITKVFTLFQRPAKTIGESLANVHLFGNKNTKLATKWTSCWNVTKAVL
ncbi:thioester-containing protein 1 allele S1-like isoform X2 [Paramacrobiotus metropolitanus]|uniref:thioester-containing protein 1 allele S1-like isoform X2 n=1 Tax=Paramacrobiotus metropolitanus TaxID=2943436 RepID=UPI002445D52B|nr:thioester-containing protein 1 allele S1-like isoform X2 [Paramacrobiotus metropolitanus]